MSEEKKHNEPEFNLDKLKSEELFKVPGGYFDQLESDILAKTVETKEDSNTKVVPMFSNAWRYGVAAAVVLLLSVGILWNSNFSVGPASVDIEAMIDEISSEELVAFLDESGITTDELLAQLDLNELDLLEEDEGFGLIDDSELDEIIDELEEFEIEELLSDI